jgi:response regulator RpfG family c-di-GMP phosphodiesterase
LDLNVKSDGSPPATPGQPREPQGTLLLVDDEPAILSSLQRLFRSQGYRLFTAESGARALEILEQQAVDLVISDMRMPAMTGAEFLAHVAERWPNVVRILLTGYSDLSSTVDAINRGAIYRYVSKPWEDNDLRLTIHSALEQQHLKRERERLVALVAKQNRELKELNTSLEAKVAARTQEIQQTADMLDLAYQEMKRGYYDAIPVFASLMELREGEVGGHGRRVGEMAREVAKAAGCDPETVQDIYFAGVLHDIGKISLPDELLRKPVVTLTAGERTQVRKHPVQGQRALMALDPLHKAALLIRHHHENFDGSGYPDQLAGDAIPLGARILAAVNDFDSLQMGGLVEGCLPLAEARQFLANASGTRYDPQVLQWVFAWLDTNPHLETAGNDIRVTSKDLQAGMVLARDLVTEDGLLLLASQRVIDERLIAHIRQFEQEENRGFTIHIKRE